LQWLKWSPVGGHKVNGFRASKGLESWKGRVLPKKEPVDLEYGIKTLALPDQGGPDARFKSRSG